MLFFSHPVSVVSCRVVSKRMNLAQSNGFLKQELAGTLDTAVNLRRGIQIQYFISLRGFVTLLPPFPPPWFLVRIASIYNPGFQCKKLGVCAGDDSMSLFLACVFFVRFV